jgi:MFS family permease
MLLGFWGRMRLSAVPRELILLAFINGLSGMALNGAAIFGMLAILSGTTFLHGTPGLAIYIALSGLATFVGYIAVCRYAARLGLKARTVLYGVFIIHAAGFLGAATIHPICVALSSGLGLGTFYAVFMLKSINDIEDKARDSYATVNGLIQRGTSLLAPILGMGMLYIGNRFGFFDPLAPTFLTFAFCVLFAIPLIRRMPDAALPCSITLPLTAIADKQHLPAIGLFLTTISCECLMYPLLIISSFALFGKVIETGWFTSSITALSVVSLALTHFLRLPGRRWIMLSSSLFGIGLGFLCFDMSFTLISLLFAGTAYAVLRVNYQATWYAFSTRIIEREWGHFGKNQALVLGEVFVFGARLGVAVFLFICGSSGFSLTRTLLALTAFYLTSATANIFIARRLDERPEFKLATVS